MAFQTYQVCLEIAPEYERALNGIQQIEELLEQNIEENNEQALGFHWCLYSREKI